MSQDNNGKTSYVQPPMSPFAKRESRRRTHRRPSFTIILRVLAIVMFLTGSALLIQAFTLCARTPAAAHTATPAPAQRNGWTPVVIQGERFFYLPAAGGLPAQLVPIPTTPSQPAPSFAHHVTTSQGNK
jgi:hypothetical protein